MDPIFPLLNNPIQQSHLDDLLNRLFQEIEQAISNHASVGYFHDRLSQLHPIVFYFSKKYQLFDGFLDLNHSALTIKITALFSQEAALLLPRDQSIRLSILEILMLYSPQMVFTLSISIEGLRTISFNNQLIDQFLQRKIFYEQHTADLCFSFQSALNDYPEVIQYLNPQVIKTLQFDALLPNSITHLTDDIQKLYEILDRFGTEKNMHNVWMKFILAQNPLIELSADNQLYALLNEKDPFGIETLFEKLIRSQNIPRIFDAWSFLFNQNDYPQILGLKKSYIRQILQLPFVDQLIAASFDQLYPLSPHLEMMDTHDFQESLISQKGNLSHHPVDYLLIDFLSLGNTEILFEIIKENQLIDVLIQCLSFTPPFMSSSHLWCWITPQKTHSTASQQLRCVVDLLDSWIQAPSLTSEMRKKIILIITDHLIPAVENLELLVTYCNHNALWISLITSSKYWDHHSIERLYPIKDLILSQPIDLFSLDHDLSPNNHMQRVQQISSALNFWKKNTYDGNITSLQKHYQFVIELKNDYTLKFISHLSHENIIYNLVDLLKKYCSITEVQDRFINEYFKNIYSLLVQLLRIRSSQNAQFFLNADHELNLFSQLLEVRSQDCLFAIGQCVMKWIQIYLQIANDHPFRRQEVIAQCHHWRCSIEIHRSIIDQSPISQQRYWAIDEVLRKFAINEETPQISFQSPQTLLFSQKYLTPSLPQKVMKNG